MRLGSSLASLAPSFQVGGPGLVTGSALTRLCTVGVALGIAVGSTIGFGGCTQQTATPNLAGQDVALTMVHTADTHSRYFPYFFAPGAIDQGLGLVPPQGKDTADVGGIARVSTVVQCMRGRMTGPLCDQIAAKTGPPAVRSLHVDSGDIFEGAPVFNLFAGEVETRAMSQLGLSVMAIGNHEFDKGAVNAFTQFQQWAGFQVLAANYDFGDPDDPNLTKFADIVGPYYIANLGGLKVGVVGMANLSSIEGIIEGGNNLGVRPIDSVNALSAVAAVLRPQVDLLVVVSHLGLDEDEDVSVADAEATDQNQEIAINGVDVIFGGHLHIVLDPPKELAHIDTNTGAQTGLTVLCHSGAFAKYVGRLDLVVHVPTDAEKAQGTHGTVKSYAYTLVPIDDTIPDDPEMDNLLEPYQIKMNTYLDLNQVYATVPCDSTDNSTQTCPKVTRTNTNGGDSQVGNLVAQSMRIRPDVSADFALTNSLGIRTDFESGELNLEQMYNVFPFDNTIATIYLSGVEIQEMLDFVSARSAERGCATQAQVSGIYYDMICATDDSRCSTRLGSPQACAENITLGDGCRNANGTLKDDQRDGTKTGCHLLRPEAEYRVAVNDYIANGGSGFAVLKRNTTKFNTGVSLRDALVDYMRGLTHRCSPSNFVNIVGVNCRNAKGELADCTTACGCHDNDSGTIEYGTTCAPYQLCRQKGMAPEIYDYSNTSCVDPYPQTPPDPTDTSAAANALRAEQSALEQPDGRILAITQAQQ